MGRALLLAAISGFALACSQGNGGVPGDPSHPELACAACHDGGLSDRRLPAVSEGSCTANGCHTDEGPSTIVLGGTPIRHRNHGDSAVASPDCAGCHTHPEAGVALAASTDACFLCHSDHVNGETAQDCRFCHDQPQHVAVASQGTPLPHSGLAWVEATCTRCHFDVARTSTHVDLVTCAGCHRDTLGAAQGGAGRNLHPIHTGISCTECHESGQHLIRAMSSAVELQCSQCHSLNHYVEVDETWDGPSGCNACHSESHQAEQALFLGHAPGRVASQPSFKFLEGMTCRSCHQPAPGASAEGGGPPPEHRAAASSTAESCASCHRPEYRSIPAWWAQGGAQRLGLVDRYVSTAERALASNPPDTVRVLLERARGALDLLADGGIAHNLEFGDRLLRESLDQIGLAYRLSAEYPPAPPDLGIRARRWFCSSCHYPLGQTRITSDMPREPHAELQRKLEREYPGADPLGMMPPVN